MFSIHFSLFHVFFTLCLSYRASFNDYYYNISQSVGTDDRNDLFIKIVEEHQI